MGAIKWGGNDEKIKLIPAIFITAQLHLLEISPVNAQPDDHAIAPAEFLKPCELENRKKDQPGIQAWCGDIDVLEDSANPELGTISLPIVYLPATNPNGRLPIFSLGGGPGLSNLYSRPIDWTYRDHDFITVGYRGADGSHILDCPEINKGQLGDGKDLLNSRSKAIFAKAVKKCVDDLQSSGIRLDNFTMMNVIDDMEAARKALGFEQILLLSESYGTRVAQIYAYEHPEIIISSVMMGVNPPGHFIWEPAIIDEQLHYLAGLCRVDASCSARTSDLALTFQRVTQDMPSSWFGIPIDHGKVRFLGQNLLHDRGTAATVIDAYLAADAGDASGLALLSLMYDMQIRFGDPQPIGDLFAKGMVDYDPTRDYDAAFSIENSIMGSATELLMAAGPAWPTAPFPEKYRKVQPTDVPTLMINGTIDFSTPYQNAERELLPLYSNGHLVTLSELGHVGDVYFNQPEAIDHLVTTFFQTGEVDASKFEHRPMNFTPSMRMPTVMKVGVLILAVVLIILVVLFWWIFRLFGRNKKTIS